MDNNGIFKKAALIQLATSVWNCSRVLNQAVLEEKIGEQISWLKGRKYLINPELLGPIRTCVSQARNTICKHSLPFPLTSVYLVPKDALRVIDERLQHYKQQFFEKVADFEAMYEVAREEAQSVLKDLFNETDYPIDIMARFNFEWRYLALGVPGKTSFLTAEMYEREKQKFQDLLDETREVSILALRKEFGDAVTHLVERLSSNGKPKVISNRMFNKINQFMDELATRNIFEDQELTELAQEARSIIGGVNSYSLRYSDNLRSQIKDDMESVKAAIDAAIEDMPRRKLRIEKIAA